MTEPSERLLRQIATDVALLKDRLEVLERDLPPIQQGTEELAVVVRELAERLAEEGASERRLRAVWWPALDADQTRAAWRSLAGWLEEVLQERHPEQYARLTGCWYQHPDVLDELCALQLAWHEAFFGRRPLATAPIEWHDRWLPAAMSRISKALASCKSAHRQVKPGSSIMTSELEAYIDQDVRQAAARSRTS